MLLLPMRIDRRCPDSSFGADMRAVERRLDRARRWRRRRRLLMLRNLVTGRGLWRVRVPVGRPVRPSVPAQVQ